MAVNACEPVTYPPLNHLIFRAKIDFIRLATPGELPLPALKGWAAAGFMDTLLRWKMEPEVVYGNEAAIQPGVQA